jgi:hypothetical protein
VAKNRRKIEKKRKINLAQAQRKLAHAAAKRKEAQRPKVTVDSAGGDTVLVKRIQSIAKDISLEESGGCPADAAELIAFCMRNGSQEAVRHIRSQAALKYDHQYEVDRELSMRFRAVCSYVGERVFEQLPDAYQKKLLPHFYFYPLIVPDGVCIKFGFIDRIKRDTGWGYYSQHEPTVTINGTDWIVCYSEHAIERIVERSNFEKRLTYGHYMDCANYLDGCVYFETVTMAQGTPAIRLFMSDILGDKPGRYRDYLHRISGIENCDQSSLVPVYVLGYCLVDCKGRFAKATSFWYPGYDGTPEDTLVRTSGLPKAEQQRLRAMANDNKTVRVINEGRHEAIRWYHDNGVPQVVSLEHGLFVWRPQKTGSPVA